MVHGEVAWLKNGEPVMAGVLEANGAWYVLARDAFVIRTNGRAIDMMFVRLSARVCIVSDSYGAL